MKIAEYIQTHALQINWVPPSLAHKFDLADDVEFYSALKAPVM